jgi:hypothetical protein
MLSMLAATLSPIYQQQQQKLAVAAMAQQVYNTMATAAVLARSPNYMNLGGPFNGTERNGKRKNKGIGERAIQPVGLLSKQFRTIFFEAIKIQN